MALDHVSADFRRVTRREIGRHSQPFLDRTELGCRALSTSQARRNADVRPIRRSNRSSGPLHTTTTGAACVAAVVLRPINAVEANASRAVRRLDRHGQSAVTDVRAGRLDQPGSPRTSLFGISMPGMLCCCIPPPIPPRIIAMLRQHGHMPDCRCVAERACRPSDRRSLGRAAAHHAGGDGVAGRLGLLASAAHHCRGRGCSRTTARARQPERSGARMTTSIFDGDTVPIAVLD